MVLKKYNLEEIYFYLVLIIPFSLIFGPVYGEIIIFISLIFFFFKKNLFKIDSFIYFFIYFLIFLFLLNILNILFLDKTYSLETFIKPIFYIRFLIFFVVTKYLFNKFSFEKYYYFMFFLLLLLSSMVIFTFLKNNFYSLASNFTSKVVITLFDRPILGYYFLIFSPLPILYFICKNFNINKLNLQTIIIIFFLFLIIVSIYLVGEKNTFLKANLFVFFIFIYTFINFNLKKIIIFLFTTFIFIFLLIFFTTNLKIYYYPIFEFIIKIFNNDFNLIEELNNRNVHSNFFHYIILFKTAFSIFLDNPIFADGLKSFRSNCNLYDYGVDLNNYRCSTHPHNYILELLSETGIIGFILFFLFLFSVFKKFIYFKNKNIFNIVSFFIFIIIIIPILPSGSFFNNYNSIIFWLTLNFVFSKRLSN